MDAALVSAVIDAATSSGRTSLLETEGQGLLRALGLATPAHLFLRAGPAAGAVAGSPAASIETVTEARLAALPGSRAVVKVIAHDILHKSDVGGVAIVDKTVAAVSAAVADMHHRLGHRAVAGYLVSEFVPYSPALGHEFIVGLRWTDDVGPVVSVGAGGIYTEFLSRHFTPGRDIAVFAPGLGSGAGVAAALGEVAVVQLATRPLRGQPPRVAMSALVDVVEAFLSLGASHGNRIAECEVNPLVVATDGRLVALDVLVTLGEAGAASPPRPVDKIARLLKPASVAIMGVSERLNPGHVIVNNLIREGFDRGAMVIVKPGSREIEGVRCVPDIESLPTPVDLFVLAVDATAASHALVEIIERQAAESVVLIPGGLEEKSGSEALVTRMRDALARARAGAWGGPVINGGNCLGIRSLPGRYDTTFIPEHKFPVPAGPPSRLAFISQSGAFALSKTTKLGVLNPKYSVTLGNQMDLTVGDYLTFLEADADLDVFAVYVEGFRPLDGLRFLQAARRIVDSGRTVILYRAGRTPAGTKASASHTASIAGDYAVMRGLCQAAGITVAETLEDFEDLTRLFSQMGSVSPPGWRLAAVSNAGFECVAIGDNLGRFTLPAFGEETSRHLQEVFEANRIAQVVDINNPLDLTPMTGDAGYVQTVAALLEDPAVDAVIVGCVPFTGALQTLPLASHHDEDLGADHGIVAGLIRLHAAAAKPMLVVVDAGPLYDAMAGKLIAAGVPTFRTADRALRLFNTFCAARLRRAPGGPGPRARA